MERLALSVRSDAGIPDALVRSIRGGVKRSLLMGFMQHSRATLREYSKTSGWGDLGESGRLLRVSRYGASPFTRGTASGLRSVSSEPGIPQ